MNIKLSHKDVKIYGFYHVCCIGNWKDIVIEQINSLVKSPLYEFLDRVFVCILITNEKDGNLNYCKTIFPDKFDISIIENDFKNYEYPILRLLHKKAHEENFYSLYFHSKGVSVNKVKRGVAYWRREMEYFLFHKFDLVLNSFESGYNAYGVNIRDYPKWPNTHFCGNFWFAKSEYIKTLPEIPININDRYFAEEWIGKGASMKAFVPYNTFIDLYHVPLPRLFYNKSLPIHVCEIFEILLFVYYKTRGFIYKKQDTE